MVQLLRTLILLRAVLVTLKLALMLLTILTVLLKHVRVIMVPQPLLLDLLALFVMLLVSIAPFALHYLNFLRLLLLVDHKLVLRVILL